MSIEDKISVILPVYNDEEYLPQCIDSIVRQTYKNVEIIIIDDGSTDSSGSICDEYKDSDFRISVVHKKHEGLAEACNFGISIAGGKYISFINPNSWLKAEMIEELISAAINLDTDITKCNFQMYDNLDDKKSENSSFSPENKIPQIPINESFSLKEHPELLTNKPFIMNCIYKRNFVKAIEFKRNKKNKTPQIAFFYETILKANRISIIAESLFYYRERKDQFDKSTNIIDEFLKVKKLLKANDVFYNYKEEFYYSAINYFKDFLTNNIEDKNKESMIKKICLFVKDMEMEGKFTYKYFTEELRFFLELLINRDFITLLSIYATKKGKIATLKESINNILKRNESGFIPYPSARLFVTIESQSPIIRNKTVMPILVDKEYGENFSNWKQKFELIDSDNNNIAQERSFYGDLTAYHWVYQNIDLFFDSSFIGFMPQNYNFIFSNSSINRLHFDRIDKKYFNILNSFQYNIYEWLQEYQLIIPEPIKIETAIFDTITEYNKPVFNTLNNILANDYPAFFNHYEKYIASTLTYTKKMFIMKKEDFIEFSHFVFEVLTKLKNQIAKEEKYKMNDIFEILIGGYISYLRSTGIKTKISPIAEIKNI